MRQAVKQHSSFRFRFTPLESCLSKPTIESEHCLVIVTHCAPRPLPREFTNSAPTLSLLHPLSLPTPPEHPLRPVQASKAGYTNTGLISSGWCVVCGLQWQRRIPAPWIVGILITHLIDGSVTPRKKDGGINGSTGSITLTFACVGVHRGGA